MVPDAVGKHYFQCSVNEHYHGGMIASYTVTADGATVQVNTTYVISPFAAYFHEPCVFRNF
jgi:hypothetical protein